MRIKSLLLGSAAASMVAVSGAQAADAIVTYVEPEPMEYVRVCDVYGAGFFYIPGTETCLRISGYARYQMGATTNRADVFGNVVNYHGFANTNSWNKYARGRLNFDARQETEWGTLRGFVRIEGDSGRTVNDNGAGQLRWVFVSLGTQQGELLAGYLESAWAWAGPIGNYGLHSDTGASYGFQRRSQVRYTFSAAEGFFGVLSLEDNSGRLGTEGRYMPDVVGKAGISQAWGGVYGAFGYDAVDRSWAARAGAQINIPNAPGSSVIGKFFWSNSAANAYAPSMYYAAAGVSAGARWSGAASFQYQFTPEVAAGLGYQYLSGHGPGRPHQHLADASLIWTPVGPDLEIRLEGGYSRARQAGVSTPGNWSGFLRFQRNF